MYHLSSELGHFWERKRASLITHWHREHKTRTVVGTLQCVFSHPVGSGLGRE